MTWQQAVSKFLPSALVLGAALLPWWLLGPGWLALVLGAVAFAVSLLPALVLRAWLCVSLGVDVAGREPPRVKLERTLPAALRAGHLVVPRFEMLRVFLGGLGIGGGLALLVNGFVLKDAELRFVGVCLLLATGWVLPLAFGPSERRHEARLRELGPELGSSHDG
jgi:hypothetical protein